MLYLCCRDMGIDFLLNTQPERLLHTFFQTSVVPCAQYTHSYWVSAFKNTKSCKNKPLPFCTASWGLALVNDPWWSVNSLFCNAKWELLYLENQENYLFFFNLFFFYIKVSIGVVNCMGHAIWGSGFRCQKQVLNKKEETERQHDHNNPISINILFINSK